jgi:choline dehydrogenase
VLGGGSSINNMSVVRPMRVDFDAWARVGGEGWSYDALLPLMRRIETDREFGASPIHGADGPIHAERAWTLDTPSPPPVRAMIEAARALGLPDCPYMNVPEPLGICASPDAIRDGRRQSTAVAYLESARVRPNLTILADTVATRLAVDGDRIVGVEVVAGGVARRIEAGAYVIACGVFHTPQLLQLSGIGPPAELERLGLAVRVPLDGVGENYQDHAVVCLTWEGTSAFREDWVVPKIRLIWRSDPALDHGDFHIFARPTIHMAGVAPMLPFSAHLLDHRSRGRLTLASTDPAADPIVRTALLEHPDDLETMVRAMEWIELLAAQPPMHEFYGRLLQPAPDEDLAAYARATYGCYYHGVGTCRFGSAADALAVVDPELRIHGLRNAWIADASVLPTLPHANTNVSAILVGEIAAQRLAQA